MSRPHRGRTRRLNAPPQQHLDENGQNARRVGAPLWGDKRGFTFRLRVRGEDARFR